MTAESFSLHLQSLVLVCILVLVSSTDFNFPDVFNFGDSNSDTGDRTAGLGIRLDLPNGQTSRLHLGDSILWHYLEQNKVNVDAMDMPFLNPYLDSIGAPIFRKGCNFAAAGSTVLPATVNAISPFSFRIQVDQFLHFKARVLRLLAKGIPFSVLMPFAFKTASLDFMPSFCYPAGKKFDKYIPREDFFAKGLYMFDIGQNDIASGLYSKSFDQVVASIPAILVEFETGLKTLYDQGARNVWIHNTGPVGCLPQNLARFGTDPSKLDEMGCLSNHNQAAKLYNLQLHALAIKLRGQYPDANITYGRYFLRFEQPLMACCGYGGPPLNYDASISCGQTKIMNGTSVTVKACDDSTEYVIWDGIHYTEAANEFVSSQILTGRFSDPPFADKMASLMKNKF
ncbi:hypothetical protein SAY86_001001 [Trapa natans]|uniref:GDSL esterase/lipase n=1 Tax=Trapa natans TaxID=22666 RepID=A0AAN7M4W2_TRANT|nr:hypothetical protein SAY86_001001 [Trapa natans]